MIIFPLIAVGVSGFFAFVLFRQFSKRHRLSLLAWSIALGMYAIASVAVAIGISNGWDPTLYKLFWLFGALLNVPWLALGSIALLNRVPGAIALVAVLAGTAWGTYKTLAGDVDPLALNGTQIPRGKDAWVLDGSVRHLASIYSIPAWAIVVLIALLTARARRGQGGIPVQRVRAHSLIAIGVTIVAVGGLALTRFGRGAPFSVTLALGIVVMFSGFLLASRQRPAITPD